MSYNLYSIYDKVAGTYASVQVNVKDELAVRDFKELCKKSPFGCDLALYRLGTYNVDTGVIVSDVQFLVNGSEFVNE